MLQVTLLQLLNQFIGATGFFALVLAFVELGTRHKTRASYLCFCLYASVGFALLVDYVNHSNLFWFFPHFAYVNDCVEFFMGAFFYLYFRALLFPDSPRFSLGYILLLPGCINLGLYLPLFAQSGFFKLNHYPVIHLGSDLSLWAYYSFINHTVELWVVFCMVLFLGRFFWSWMVTREIRPRVVPFLRQQRRVVLGYTLSWVVIMTFFFLSNFWPQYINQRIVIALSCTLVIILYFILQRYRDYLADTSDALHGVPLPARLETLELNQEKRELRYKASKLQNMDVFSLRSRLLDLVSRDDIICDPGLSLEALSTLLGVTSHQLSELLNTQFSSNFRQFLHVHRIERVKEQLVSHPEKSILDVSVDCGFNTKATFNSVFFKATGLTPREYRERALAGTLPPLGPPKDGLHS